MNDIHILGRYPMYGELVTQGSKNAVLPLMAASLLHRGVTVLENVPAIADVDCMVRILEGLGASINRNGGQMQIDASCLTSCEISLEDVRKMRSSIMVLGALVARMGQA
ncbi:MAG: UDP-N-acetylglucosamine 1-carboxyvinyltransferase, partial [Lachnospiraceae bacterium]|nr:UDP-N-acetylglucosamine 1-carboxyvinyltransferase [Lachnospiraceae bacterium]